MADQLVSETTDPLGLELRHLRERQDEWNERQDRRLDKHGAELDALKAIAAELKGAWKVAAAIGAFVGLVSSLLTAWMSKGG